MNDHVSSHQTLQSLPTLLTFSGQHMFHNESIKKVTCLGILYAGDSEVVGSSNACQDELGLVSNWFWVTSFVYVS